MLSESGVDFMSIHEMATNLDESDFNDATAYKESLFCLSMSGTPITFPKTDDKQTLARAIAPGGEEIAVTFSRDCADEFPSIQYLAPGNLLFTQLVNAVRSSSDIAERFRRYAIFR